MPRNVKSALQLPLLCSSSFAYKLKTIPSRKRSRTERPDMPYLIDFTEICLLVWIFSRCWVEKSRNYSWKLSLIGPMVKWSAMFLIQCHCATQYAVYKYWRLSQIFYILSSFPLKVDSLWFIVLKQCLFCSFCLGFRKSWPKSCWTLLQIAGKQKYKFHCGVFSFSF